MAERQRDDGGDGRWALVAVAGVVGLVFLWIVSGSLTASVGPTLRSAALVYVDEDPSGSGLEYDDGSAEAAAFLGARDSVTVVVPWDMTSADFLRLYHLENNRSAAGALEALGASAPEVWLAEGTRLRFSLTPAEVVR